MTRAGGVEPRYQFEARLALSRRRTTFVGIVGIILACAVLAWVIQPQVTIAVQAVLTLTLTLTVAVAVETAAIIGLIVKARRQAKRISSLTDDEAASDEYAGEKGGKS